MFSEGCFRALLQKITRLEGSLPTQRRMQITYHLLETSKVTWKGYFSVCVSAQSVTELAQNKRQSK